MALDHQRRIESLLERAPPSEHTELLRQMRRVIEVLEIVGGAESRRLLEKLTWRSGARLDGARRRRR